MSDGPRQAAGAPGAADRRRIAHVHPPDWRNPEPARRYHLVVVGAGTAGLVAAAGAAGLGARVALVERGLMGGDCLNVGCVPSKGLLRAARAWHAARTAADRFGGPVVAGAGDFAAAAERMRRLRADLAAHDGAARFRDLGVDVFLGHGRFVARDAVEVEGRRLRFRRALVATGARPELPPVPGLAAAGALTHETLFDLERAPARLAVVGAGPIGCEMAQAFARFGSAVTLLDRADRILGRDDPDAAAVVRRALERDRVRCALGVEIERVESAGAERVLHLRRDGAAERVVADAILVAAGRLPNVEDLGLDAAGVAHGPGGVEVDDRLRTSNRRVFAAGDVASPWKFTHLADAEARIVLENALFFGRRRATALVVPWCTYTSPELAQVGLTAERARQRGIAVDTVTVPLASVDRARLDGEDEGFLRLHLGRGGDTVVGATLVAAHAGETLGELALAVSAGIGLGRLGEVIHAYPTQAEAIRKAADARRRERLTPAVRRLLALWFRVFG